MRFHPFAVISFALGVSTSPALQAGVTPIADIHANLGSFLGQVVTVEAQVYIPTNYRAGLFTGYVQDGSGRGINLFGSGADNAILFDTSNVAQVTGTVELFFTTVEITNITGVTLVSSGNAPLTPEVLTTGNAASSIWEGTFIQSTGDIVGIAAAGSGTNYTINDGSGALVVRIVDSLGAPSFSLGQTLTARGAGAQFQSDFQILVGSPTDAFVGVVGVEQSRWGWVKTSYR